MTTIRDVFNSPDVRTLSVDASIDFIERYLGFIIFNPDACRLVLKTHQNKYFDAPRLMTHKTKMGVYLATDEYGLLAGSLRKAVTGGQDKQVLVTGYLGLTLFQDYQTGYGVNFHMYHREDNDYDDMIRVEINPHVLQKTRHFFLNGVKDAISFTNARTLLALSRQFFDSLRWLSQNGVPLDAEISLLPEYCYTPTTKQFKHNT